MAEAGAPWPAAIGVSGGSDSLALMHLMQEWAEAAGRPPPVVLCVDHGLRAEARKEARQVLNWAKAAGLRAAVLVNRGKTPHSDIESQAREARYRLMGNWAKRHGLKALYVAHTRDDQAETFLLRLARGSGVDGLAAMRPLAPFPDAGFDELKLVRPLLAFDRQELRRYLGQRGQDWFEDPMNEDRRFARARLRNLWPVLEAEGLTRQRVADAALHLGRARDALETVSGAVLLRACRTEAGKLLLDPKALTAAPREIALRALASVLMIVSGARYRPRFERLAALFEALRTDSLGRGRTLHGCKIAPAPRRLAPPGSGYLLVEAEKPRRQPGKTALKSAQ